jgi:hypothetical protein
VDRAVPESLVPSFFCGRAAKTCFHAAKLDVQWQLRQNGNKKPRNKIFGVSFDKYL